MAGEAKVTISFKTTLPVAMIADWPAALGLLDPKKMRDLQIRGLEVEIEGETRIGPDEGLDLRAIEEAQQRVALAGRELGSGPAEAVKRLVPEGVDERLRYGVAIGLVAAGWPDALAELDAIEREWRTAP